MGLMFISYNLRRIVNILTADLLKEYLRILVSSILMIFGLAGTVLMSSEELVPAKINLQAKNRQWLKFA